MTRTLSVHGKPVGGMCDRCGQRYALKELKTEYKQGRPTDLLVCPICWDEEHDQEPIRWPTPNDKQSIENPRPEKNIDEGRSMWAWDSVANPAVIVTVRGGKVHIS